MVRFKPSSRVQGFFYILDDKDTKVFLKNNEGVLKPKKFKTFAKAVEFAKHMNRLDLIKEKEKSSD